jgi:peptide/nickel transport system ATP-binding protein
MENLLEIKDLKTQFFTKKGIVPAVDSVDLNIPHGKIIGVVGESGCGKSVTALSVMQILQHPGKVVSGSIKLNGDDLLLKSKKEMRRIRGDKISMIFQEPMTSLNPLYTVGRQVSEAITIHRKISKKEAREKVIGMFEKVGIPEPKKRYANFPHQLSGGLRQRVMIGMALVLEPDLVIADEPTTALDVTIEAQILHLMRELQKNNNTSIMMITHNLGVVAELCDDVYVMYAGKVMEKTDVYTLFKNPLHPYTFGLLNSLPKLTQQTNRLYTIRGIVPNLLKLPKGCRFCTRCDKVMKVCTERQPDLYEISPGHSVRCFLYEKDAIVKKGEASND